MTEKVFHLLFWMIIGSGVALGQTGQYVIPDLQLYALSPKGFRAELPDDPGIELFTFHGKLNDKLDASKEGDIVGDINSPIDGKWVFEDPNLELSVGDKIYYWVYVQYNKAGYTKRDLFWEITELVEEICRPPTTTASGSDMKICAGNIIFMDEFNGDKVDRNKWTVQKYIPSITDDDHYEFVSYQDRDANHFIKNSVLHLRPIAATTRAEVFGRLDLSQGCTRSKQNSCSVQQVGGYILPPVTSAKIISKMSFKYGKIEIKAKLPIGDWIYPQVELIPKDKLPSYPKILMAYSRANRNLTLANGFDIGNTLLFGGPASSAQESERSTNLKSRRLLIPAGRDVRTYTITWSPAQMAFMIDNDLYGTVLSNEYKGFNAEYQIALGVGVGGNYDFPDNIRSGIYRKPWTNFAPQTMKNFFDQKDFWISTWTKDDVDLQVDSVKVWAV